MKLIGVLIDPFTKTITEIEVENDLHVWYKLLDCELVDVIRLTARVDLWIDDEGLFKEPPKQAYFYIADLLEPVAGRALLLSHDAGGNSRSLLTKAAEIEPYVCFVNTGIKGFRPPRPSLPEIWVLDESLRLTRRLD